MSGATVNVTGRPLRDAVAALCALEVGARVTVQGGPLAGRWLKCKVANPADEWAESWTSFDSGALACARDLVEGCEGIVFAWDLLDNIEDPVVLGTFRLPDGRVVTRPPDFPTPVFELGDRVRIVDADDVEGRIVDHTRYLDGSERWGVAYWHNGEREHVNCRAEELERLR